MIRSAFLSVGGALPSGRPADCRASFDNASRTHGASSPWEAVQGPVCAVARAAAWDGRPIVIAEARARIEAFYATLRAEALALLPDPANDVPVEVAVMDETKAECAANPDEMAVMQDPTSRPRIEQALVTARAHAARIQRFISCAERTLFARQQKTQAVR